MNKARKTKIQLRNEANILQAAREVFADWGYRGATMERIAELAEMSQPNIHRYFPKKADLYLTVLRETLAVWMAPLHDLDPDGDPDEELRRYIGAKMKSARLDPVSSRVFGHEMLDGAPVLTPYLASELKENVATFVAAVGKWVAEGKIKPVDANHLLLMIWATTQHYSDCSAQVTALLGITRMKKQDFDAAEHSICEIIIRGVLK